MTSFLHKSDCGPNQEKRNIEQPNIEKLKQKLVSLCFTFAFCCCLFSAHISADLFRYFRLFLLLFVCGWQHQLTDSSLKAKDLFWGRDRETDNETTWSTRGQRGLLRHWNRNHVLVKVGCPVQKSKSKTHNKCKSATNAGGVKSHSHSHSESFQTIVSCGTHA